MFTNTTPRMFSRETETIEQAQDLYHYELFNPAAVFKTPAGKFVMGYIREQNYPPHETAKAVKALNGYEMVSCADGVLGVWKEYKAENEVKAAIDKQNAGDVK